ncbi:MAG: low molecular weight protein-tyrosine-phosphatase [Pseudomonadota bacterium]
MKAEQPIRVLFICLGNICRSPTAEAVFRHQVQQAGWQAMIQADSAGTAAWHIGKAPDARSQQHARVRGYDLSSLRARQISKSDFAEFDHIIAMDAANFAKLKRLRSAAGEAATAQLSLLLDHHPELQGADVPDPYYGGADGFEQVLDQVEVACTQLLRSLLKTQGVFGCGC